MAASEVKSLFNANSELDLVDMKSGVNFWVIESGLVNMVASEFKFLACEASEVTSVFTISMADWLKVSKFHKQIFLFSFEPKSEQNCFLISALASKRDQSIC